MLWKMLCYDAMKNAMLQCYATILYYDAIKKTIKNAMKNAIKMLRKMLYYNVEIISKLY